MIKNFVTNLLKNLGPSLNIKFIIIESDDWGSLRMPSNDTYEKLEKSGVQLKFPGSDQYNLYDTLENTQDLELLFETLAPIKDCVGRSANFTALTLSANPDFDKIQESNFEKYSYLNLKQSFEKYQKGDVLSLYAKGIEEGIFIPQFHGREHLNVPLWMRALKNNIGDARLAFDYGVWGHINTHPKNLFYQAAFDVEYPEDIIEHHQIVKDGLALFERTFGYKASYFVPPNGPMNNSLLSILADYGVRLVSSDTIQVEVLGNGKTKKHFRYMGMKNKLGQRFIKRNCFFEPSGEGKDWVDSCLKDIEFAFKNKKPAVISTHRVNYMGGLSDINRVRGLFQLKELLQTILKKWPDVQFITTSELYDLFENK